MTPQRPRSRWRWGVVLLTAVLAAAGWCGVRAHQVRVALTAAAHDGAELTAAVRDGNFGRAERAASSLRRHTGQAQAAAADPLWQLAGRVPFAGHSPQTISRLAAAGDVVARDVVPPLLDAAQQVWVTQPGDLAIDLRALRALQPQLADAGASVARASALVEQAPKVGVPPTLLAAAARAQAQLDRLSEAVDAADAGAQLAPPMLGADRPRRYFLALQNTAEARGTGGLLGLFGVLEAVDGRLRLVRLAGTEQLPKPVRPALAAPQDLRERFAAFAPDRSWANANLTEHFPDAAAVWLEMWQAGTGERLDGVIAVEPTMLRFLLAASGPVVLPDGSAVSEHNVVHLTQDAAYRDITDVRARKAHLAALVEAVLEPVLAGGVAPDQVVRALARAARERRLLVASADPAEQVLLARTAASGAVPSEDQPFAMLTVNNAGGNKLDAYLERSLDYVAGPCANGRRSSSVTVRLHNGTPVGLPDYVTGRVDARRSALPYGQHKVIVSVVGSRGAQLRAASLDARPVLVRAASQRGRPVFELHVDLSRLQSRELVLQLSEPALPGKPITVVQPLARPAVVTASAGRC